MRREWNSPLNELFWSIVETTLRSSLESLAKDWWWQQARQIWANRSQILRWFQIYTKPNTAKWGPNAALISYKWDHRSSLLSLMTNLYTNLLGGKDLTQSEKIKIYSKDWKVRFLLTSHFTGLGLLQTDLFSVFPKKLRKHIDEISDDWHTLISSNMSISHLVLTWINQHLNFINSTTKQ